LPNQKISNGFISYELFPFQAQPLLSTHAHSSTQPS
jgi:hypothetical protein